MNAPAHIASLLQKDGLAVIENFFSPQEWESVLSIYAQRLADGSFRNARVGAGNATLDWEVRKDQVSWIEGDETDLVWLAQKMGKFRNTFNRELFLGLRDEEMHFALYPEGAFYRRHRDRFKGSERRVVSFVAYLNPHWKKSWGGQLKVLTMAGELEILPQPNRAVFFLSELEHEVLETRHPRQSLTAWFRRPDSVLL